MPRFKRADGTWASWESKEEKAAKAARKRKRKAKAKAKPKKKKAAAKKKKSTRRAARPRTPTFLAGYHDAVADLRSKRPLRRTQGRKDEYCEGYRAGARVERRRAKASR